MSFTMTADSIHTGPCNDSIYKIGRTSWVQSEYRECGTRSTCMLFFSNRPLCPRSGLSGHQVGRTRARAIDLVWRLPLEMKYCLSRYH